MRTPKYDPEQIRSDLDRYGSLHLNYKWTTSRGRDTYGYNICTLRVYGEAVARCCGGGYDMEGSCLGEFVTAIFKPELIELAKQAVHGHGYSDGREYGCYGLISWSDDPAHVYIDGGCGTTENILRHFGYRIRYQSRHNYILEKVGE